MRWIRSAFRARGAFLVCAALTTACASNELPPLVPLYEESAAEESTPLGGEQLANRKHEMQSAYRDMIHFHTTLESLNQRRDQNGFILFRGFLDEYMGVHLDPLLRSEWQSRHPELMALDVNLRLLKADVLIQMHTPRRIQQVIDEVRVRFEGRGDMLVDYPVGSQGTLEEALEILGKRKWRG